MNNFSVLRPRTLSAMSLVYVELRVLLACHLERVSVTSCGWSCTGALRAQSGAGVGSAPPAAFSASQQRYSSGSASAQVGWHHALPWALGSGSGWWGQKARSGDGAGKAVPGSALLRLPPPP